MNESSRCTGVFGGFLGGGGDNNPARPLASRRPTGSFISPGRGEETGSFTGSPGGDGAAGVAGDCALPSGSAAAGGEESSGESVSPLSSARAALRPAPPRAKPSTVFTTSPRGSGGSALAFGSLSECKTLMIPPRTSLRGGGRLSTTPLLCRLSVMMSGMKVAVVQLVDLLFD